LLAGLPDNLIQKLQYVQNCAAKVIFNEKKYDHVTPLLKKLQWLPVRQRITNKIAMLYHKIKKNDEPRYLRELLIKPFNTRNTHSSNDSTLLLIPRTKLITYGDRSFAHFGPFIWNSIPRNIREETSTMIFKRELKTFLFDEAYTV
jgi:hypothetical protein